MKAALKLSLFGTSAFAISMPVAANYNHGLRGMFTTPQTHNAQYFAPQLVSSDETEAQVINVGFKAQF